MAFNEGTLGAFGMGWIVGEVKGEMFSFSREMIYISGSSPSCKYTDEYL